MRAIYLCFECDARRGSWSASCARCGGSFEQIGGDLMHDEGGGSETPEGLDNRAYQAKQQTRLVCEGTLKGYSVQLTEETKAGAVFYGGEILKQKEYSVHIEKKNFLPRAREVIEETNPDALLADGFDDAIIGMIERAGGLPVVCYDVNKCLEILGGGDKAVEFFYYNVVGAYMGEHTPVFLRRFE